MNNFEIVIADSTKVKMEKGPVSPAVKHILTEEKKQTLDTTPDDKIVYWADVKKAYPELEAQLKNLFGGKDKMSVKDLREIVTKVPAEEAKYWISQTTWESGLQRELGRNHKQIVIQLNIGKPIVDAIHLDPIVSQFFKDVSKKMGGTSSHPTHSQTIAWARVYPMKDKYIIEEIQSDLFGATTRLKDAANGEIETMLSEFKDEEKKHIQEFLHKHFTDWDKKLLATVISMARKEGINDIWIFDEDAKKVNLTSPSKLERFYKVLPRDLGFKRGTIEVDDKKFGGWHRIVATSHLQRINAHFK